MTTLLAVGLPVVCALSWAGAATGPADGSSPSTAEVGIVAEQVATARDITPFGVSRDGDARTVWAFGRTRGASIEDPGPAAVPDSPSPGRDPEPPDSGNDIDGEREALGARAAAPTTPATTVLLAGVARQAGTPTSWRRAPEPTDQDGDPLDGADWRPAGGDAPLHAGEATPRGAAAILAQLGPTAAPTVRPAVLARTAEGRFQALPAPPDALLAPATEPFEAGLRSARLPFAVVDLPARGADPGSATTPDPSGPSSPLATSPDAQLDRLVAAPPLAPPEVATGVLLAPPGGDGVLSWTGRAWVEEPYLARDGTRPDGGRSPVALAATPEGDGVALLQNVDPASTDRFRLYRRTADHTAWREVTLPAAPSLLTGPLPREVTSVSATPAPGDPLTVVDGHWWIDLIATRDDGVRVSATVHLTPSRTGEPATTPGETTPAPTTPGSTPPTSTPATTPTPTTPASTPDPSTPTTPDPTTPSTPGATTPSTTPPSQATTVSLDGPWCQPTLAGCDRELRAEFPTARGYRSQAFAGAGVGGRSITSPVIPEATGAETVRDASASGGYLSLDGEGQFRLRSGVGDAGDGLGGTEAAAFDGPGLGWVGARRAVGHVMPYSATAGARLRDDNAIEAGFGRLIDQADTLIDVAAAPPGSDGTLEAVALGSTNNIRLKRPGRPWVGVGFVDLFESERLDDRAFARAMAWPSPGRIVVVGSRGMLLQGDERALVGEGSRRSDREPRPPGGVVSVAEGLDLLDVAFRSDGAQGWAVGRSGAAVFFNGQTWGRLLLSAPDPVASADLRQVAYAAEDAWIASSVGLLRAPGPVAGIPTTTLPVDEGLAALMARDGRGPGVRTVATLPDGTVVVDARYVTIATPGRPPTWRRLPHPAEGDTIAVALRRVPTADGASGLGAGLQVVASIADEVPPRRGLAPGLDDPELAEDVFDEDDSDEIRGIELAPELRDGRVTVLGPDGWVDVSRSPIERSPGTDLPFLASPIGAFALRDSATSWAVGGRGTSGRIDGAFAQTPFAATIPFGDVDAPGSPENAGDEAVVAATEPAAAPSPAQDASPGGNASTGTVRILIGGHPSCLDECAGREDQRIGPTETLRQALQTASRTAAGGNGSPAVGAVVIGGGRSARPLSALGAESYGSLLQSVPGAPPVFPAIGSSDAQTPASRERYGRYVGARFAPQILAAAGSIVGAQRPPGSGAGTGDQAYAFEVGGVQPVRVLVIDNAGGPLRGGRNGEQARWIASTLAEGRARGLVSIVIGSVPLDRRSAVDPTELGAQLDLLASGGAAAYVSTDGGDDPRNLATFGPRMRREVVSVAGRQLQLLHSSALGHFVTNQALIRYLLADGPPEDSPPPAPEPTTPAAPGATTPSTPGTTPPTAQPAVPESNALADYTLQPQLLAIDVDTTRPSDPSTVTASNVPVLRDFAPADRRLVTRTFAQVVSVTTEVDADNGLRLVDDRRPEAGLQDNIGAGVGGATAEQCGLFGSEEDCAGAPQTDMRFEVADPSIAVFVRARVRRTRLPGAREPSSEPQIVLDTAGNPVVDPRSPVLCPIRAGSTSYVVTTAGRSLRIPLVVREPVDGLVQNNGGGPSAPCGFTYEGDRGEPTPVNEPDEDPVPVELPGVPGTLQPPVPATPADPRPPSVSTPSVPPVVASIAPPLLLPYLDPVAEPAGPPAVPNPKPVTPAAPPAPPSGVGVQQVPAPNVQPVTAQGVQNLVVAARAEERRREVARESSDHSATVYAQPTRPDLSAALTVGGLAVLAAGGGIIAGRRRRLAQASRPARAWLG